MSARIGTLRINPDGSTFRLVGDIHASASTKPTILEAVEALSAQVAALTVQFQRQQRHPAGPPPERRTQTSHELDAAFQAEHGGTATIAQRISREIQARGLANPPTIRHTSGAPTPDYRMTPVDPNELIDIGPGMCKRRKDFEGTVFPEVNSPLANGGYVADPRHADIHHSVEPGSMEAVDAQAKQDGLSIQQRMALALQRSWNA